MPRILVVDDSKVSQLSAVLTLKKLGFDVDVVGNGAEALEACAVFCYDAVLMDCVMPELDGYGATAKLRRTLSRHCTCRTPIIGVSTLSGESDRRAALAVGMDAYVVKPLLGGELSAVLAECLTAHDQGLRRLPADAGMAGRS